MLLGSLLVRGLRRLLLLLLLLPPPPRAGVMPLRSSPFFSSPSLLLLAPSLALPEPVGEVPPAPTCCGGGGWGAVMEAVEMVAGM
jgi:hypothetical protein